MMYVYLWLKSWYESEEGQDLIEYVLIAGLIALVAVLAITGAGESINGVWKAVADELEGLVP
jgi:pilus assembly protein Flp/PilA